VITEDRLHQGQRLYREQDPRVRRSLVVALLSSALLVAAGLGVAALRVHQIQLAYRLDSLRADRARTERLVRQLEVEIATLRSPSRLESRARQLGMTAPTREQVRLAREYVPSGRGTAAAQVAGTEAFVR
jgi:cell division protein FtsL